MIAAIFGRFRPIDSSPLPIALLLSALLLLPRYYLALPFWKSGWTKWTSFPTELKGSAPFLFEHEYKLHIFGNVIDMPYPAQMAFLAGLAEVILPVLLVVGIFSRFAALGLLGMTVVIQLVYPGAWMLHGQWAIMALIVIVAGPGWISVDGAIRGATGTLRPNT